MNNINKINNYNTNFIFWFVGFSDGEGFFIINKIKNKFRFIFRIRLHFDDVETLYYIKNKLNVGQVYKYPKIS